MGVLFVSLITAACYGNFWESLISGIFVGGERERQLIFTGNDQRHTGWFERLRFICDFLPKLFCSLHFLMPILGRDSVL